MDVQLIMNRSSSHNFGFVTYYRREAAGRAICEAHNRPPLNMTVHYNRKPEAREQELQKKLQEICDVKPLGNDELEDDWDKEIEKEEEMIASLDKFREDYSSGEDEEISVDKVKKLPVILEEKENVTKSLKPPCKRCGKESKFVCKRCSVERYCSEACQKLDWPLHRTSCKLKPDPEDDTFSKQEIVVTAEIHQEDLHSSADAMDHVNRRLNSGSDRALQACPTPSKEVPKIVYFEKDLPVRKIDDWSEKTPFSLLEVEGHWAHVRPVKKGNCDDLLCMYILN